MFHRRRFQCRGYTWLMLFHEMNGLGFQIGPFDITQKTDGRLNFGLLFYSEPSVGNVSVYPFGADSVYFLLCPDDCKGKGIDIQGPSGIRWSINQSYRHVVES